MAGGQFIVRRTDLDVVEIVVLAPDQDTDEVHEVVLTMDTADATFFANRILQSAGLSWSPEVTE